MAKTFRVAVIGCGAISGNHLSAITAAGQTVCALCDIDTAKAEEKAAEFGLNVPIYADYETLFRAENPDCVHICTPHYLHADMCVAALSRNIHVLCEKPLAMTRTQLDAVLAAAKSSSATLGVCLQNRYEPNMVQMKALAEAGVVSLAGSVFWDRDEAYYRSSDWRGKWATEGGGVLINQALHTLDLVQWLGGMPKYVTAHCSNDHLRDVIEVEDTAFARLETADGQVFSFVATTGCGYSFPAMVQMRTADGKTCIATSKSLTVNGQALPSPAEETAGKAVWGNGHKRLITDFYTCLQEGRPFPIDAFEGSKVLLMIWGVYASNGQRLTLDIPM